MAAVGRVVQFGQAVRTDKTIGRYMDIGRVPGLTVEDGECGCRFGWQFSLDSLAGADKGGASFSKASLNRWSWSGCPSAWISTAPLALRTQPVMPCRWASR